MADVSEFLAQVRAGVEEHLRVYLETDGDQGYYRDMSESGGGKATACLVLKTIGRRSGRPRLAPLLYAPWGDEYVIVASKGGADKNPSWYDNLLAQPDVAFQVRNKKFRAAWRVVEGEERDKIWTYASLYYPAYLEYQARTQRKIPVIVLTPQERIEETWTAPPKR